MPGRDADCDHRFILVTKTERGACVYADDIPVRYLHTGDVIFKYCVPDWWMRDYDSYVSFVGCLQHLWSVNWIRAIKLLKTQCDLSLRDAKELTEDLCKALSA